jgi:hypothetical protein
MTTTQERIAALKARAAARAEADRLREEEARRINGELGGAAARLEKSLGELAGIPVRAAGFAGATRVRSFRFDGAGPAWSVALECPGDADADVELAAFNIRWSDAGGGPVYFACEVDPEGQGAVTERAVTEAEALTLAVAAAEKYLDA